VPFPPPKRFSAADVEAFNRFARKTGLEPMFPAGTPLHHGQHPVTCPECNRFRKLPKKRRADERQPWDPSASRRS
jgi:hypothetical protein